MKNIYLFFACTLLVCQSVTGNAQIGQKMKQESAGGITGLWRNSSFGFNMDLLLELGGKGQFDAVPIKWQSEGAKLIITEGNNKTTYHVQLQTNTLTLSGGDLDEPVTFNRIKDGETSPVNPAGNTAPNSSNTQSSIVGIWVAQNEEISFTADGKFIYNGVPLTYAIQGTQINVSAPAGSIVFFYELTGNSLTLKSDGVNATYTRKGSNANVAGNGSVQPGPQPDASGGIIDQTLVGKWAYIGSANNPSGSFSTEEYITLHADGTYEYYSESSGTARGSDMYGNQTYAGGTASQGSDRGTWRVKGSTIIANSQRNGVKVYQLQKKNHPKNGDPMIILDGTAYVTYYQKAPWR